jgi:hypothetical protein
MEFEEIVGHLANQLDEWPVTREPRVVDQQLDVISSGASLDRGESFGFREICR